MLRAAEIRTTEPSILLLDSGLVAAGVSSEPGKLDNPAPTWRSERGPSIPDESRWHLYLGIRVRSHSERHPVSADVGS